MIYKKKSLAKDLVKFFFEGVQLYNKSLENHGVLIGKGDISKWFI